MQTNPDRVKPFSFPFTGDMTSTPFSFGSLAKPGMETVGAKHGEKREEEGEEEQPPLYCRVVSLQYVLKDGSIQVGVMAQIGGNFHVEVH